MNTLSIKISFQLLIILLWYSGYQFYYHTKGLLFLGNRSRIVYVSALQSSGSEDNIFVFPILGVYGLLFLLSFIVRNRALFYGSLLSMLVFLLSLSFIQVGEILNTIANGNLYLALMITAPFVLLYLSFLIRNK